MSTWVQDVRYGLRMLARAPVVSTVAALSLALGIAANASTFSVLDAFLLDPLPYRDQDGLVILREGRQGLPVEAFSGVAMGNFRDYERASPSIAAAGAYTLTDVNLTGGDVPEQLRLVEATPNLFDVLGVAPSLGRGFRPEEGAEGVGTVVVLEHDFWRRHFAEDRDVLGRTLTLDGATHTVIGVMPESFDLIPADVDAFRPTGFAAQRENRDVHGYLVLGRLVPGATAAQVQSELDGVSARIAAEHPEGNRGWVLAVIPLRGFFPGATDKKLVLVLTAVTLFGLLIACANVANLLLGRAEERQKEVAVRTALGAGRARILRQLLTESVSLGLLAGVLGTALAVFVVRWIRAAMPPMIPKAMVPSLDPEVVAASLGVSILAGIAFGIAPSFHATRGDLREALAEGSRGGTASRSRRRLRSVFVVGEFAVALALLTGAAFLMEVFRQVIDADPGFRQEGLLTFSLAVPADRYPVDDNLATYQEEIVAALAGVPGVRRVALMSSLPRSMGNPGTRYAVAGRPVPSDAELPRADLQAVNPDYLGAMEIPLVRGRGFTDTDRSGGQPVALVSEAFVAREFRDEDPLGREITFRDRSWVIVGIVGDILQDRIALAGDRGEAIYVPAAQLPTRGPSFALRAAGDPDALAADVRRAVWSVDPDQPLAQVRSLDAHVAESLSGPRAISLFVGAMGLIALLLAAMGIYGVMAHSVTQQRREIGIRIALGAGRGTVVGMVTRSGLTLAGLGMALGIPLAWLMYRAVANALNLFEGGGAGLFAAAAVVIALGLVAAVATWVPAMRASGVEPVAALRD